MCGMSDMDVILEREIKNFFSFFFLATKNVVDRRIMSNRCGKLFTDGDPTYWDCTAAWSLLIQQMQFGIKKKKKYMYTFWER